MNSMRRQKKMILKDELPRLVGAQYALEKSGEITPERKKRWTQRPVVDVTDDGSKV